MRKMLLALTITIVLSLVFGGVLVFAANAAAPGDPLYGLDRGLETMQLGLTRSQRGALQLEEQLASERLVELQSLAARGDQQVLENTVFTSSELAVLLDDNSNVNGNGNGNDNDNTNDNANDNTNDNTNDSTKGGAYCRGGSGKHHPTGEKLAERYSVSYDEVMGWFCDGRYGFGEIDLGYRISQAAGVSVTEVFDKRATGMGWGNILKEYGLDKKPGKPPKPPKPVNGNGNGGGNGNGHGNSNGQGNGHDKPKDKGNKGKP